VETGHTFVEVLQLLDIDVAEQTVVFRLEEFQTGLQFFLFAFNDGSGKPSGIK